MKLTGSKWLTGPGPHRRRAGERRRRCYRASPDPRPRQFDPEQQDEPFRGSAPAKRSPEIAQVKPSAAELSGQMTNSPYRPREYAKKSSKDAQAHQGDYELLNEVDCGRG
jgi:hypothetical protein